MRQRRAGSPRDRRPTARCHCSSTLRESSPSGDQARAQARAQQRAQQRIRAPQSESLARAPVAETPHTWRTAPAQRRVMRIASSIFIYVCILAEYQAAWDGGGAHANSRWSEELVRTERERECVCVHYSRTVWHGERDTESLARYFYLKNRSHWEVPVFEGKPSTSWRDPIIPILL